MIIGYPLLFSLWSSFVNLDVFSGQSPFVGLANYVRIFNDAQIFYSTLVTARFATESILISIVISLGVALLLNEDFFGRGILRVAALLPWAASEYAVASMWKNVIQPTYGPFSDLLIRLGIIHTTVDYLSAEHALDWLALVWAWHWAPLGAFFLLAALQTIPPVLYNAARMDGAGPVRRFAKITLPHIKYAFLIVVVLFTLEALRSFDIIYVMTGGGPGAASKTLTLRIYENYFRYSQYSYAAAVSYYLITIAFIVGTLYFIALSRRRRRISA